LPFSARRSVFERGRPGQTPDPSQPAEPTSAPSRGAVQHLQVLEEIAGPNGTAARSMGSSCDRLSIDMPAVFEETISAAEVDNVLALEASTPVPVHVQNTAEAASTDDKIAAIDDTVMPDDSLAISARELALQLENLRGRALTADSVGSFSSVYSFGSVAQCDWTPDSATCQICSAKFSMTKRRHHCRKCGKCVCKACSPNKMSLDGYKGLQRVCCTCTRSYCEWHSDQRDELDEVASAWPTQAEVAYC